MLRLPPFRLHVPRTLGDAVALLAGAGAIGANGGAPAHDAIRVVAGGTDLWPNMKRRQQAAASVVALRGVPELRGVRGAPGAEMRLGATTTLAEVAAHAGIRKSHPALARAVASISSPVLRNMGTIGGNLCLDTRCTYLNQTEEWRRSINYCMKAAGEICWVAPSSPRCWAVSSSDAAPMLCALGARVRLVSAEGERVIDVRDLFRDDGIDYLAKRPDEILTEVLLAPPDGYRASFWKLRRRGSIDFAVLTVAPVIWRDKRGVVEKAAIYLGAVNSAPSRADAVERGLVGKPLTVENIAAAAAEARRAATPMDNTDFVARWRGQMVVKYLEAALREIAGLDPGRLPPKHEL